MPSPKNFQAALCVWKKKLNFCTTFTLKYLLLLFGERYVELNLIFKSHIFQIYLHSIWKFYYIRAFLINIPNFVLFSKGIKEPEILCHIRIFSHSDRLWAVHKVMNWEILKQHCYGQSGVPHYGAPHNQILVFARKTAEFNKFFYLLQAEYRVIYILSELPMRLGQITTKWMLSQTKTWVCFIFFLLMCYVCGPTRSLFLAVSDALWITQVRTWIKRRRMILKADCGSFPAYLVHLFVDLLIGGEK